FDLTFYIEESRSKGLVLNIEYATDLYEAATIQRMAGHFNRLLTSSVETPHQSIGTLPFLTEAEKRQLVVEWNDTKQEYPREQTIHYLIEKQVEETPQAPAVIFEGESLSYQALNEKANQLAHYLRNCGVGLETLVAISLERSLELVISLLAILKAGGAYVPLDPNYPVDRL